MFHNGIPLSGALDVLSRDPDAAFAPVATEVQRKLEAGNSLSDALRQNDVNFPKSLIVLVTIGEQTGTLAKSLIQSADWMDEDEGLVRSVKAALTYPLLVIALTLGLSLFLFTTVVPRLLEVVVALGADLPLATRIISVICTVVAEPAFWLTGLGTGCLVAYALTIEDVRIRAEAELVKFGLALPILGPTLVAFFHARFCTGMAVLAENGVDVLRAISLAQQVSGHPAMIADIEAFRSRVSEGQGLADSMRSRPDVYDQMLVSFTMLGEESATLGESLRRAGSLYKMIVEEKLAVLKQALEPLLTCAVGAIVGFVLVATLLPLYSVLSKF
jgi:type IV pilus assembly protein PilC